MRILTPKDFVRYYRRSVTAFGLRTATGRTEGGNRRLVRKDVLMPHGLHGQKKVDEPPSKQQVVL